MPSSIGPAIGTVCGAAVTAMTGSGQTVTQVAISRPAPILIWAEGWTGHSEPGPGTFSPPDLARKVYPPGGEPYEVPY